MAVVAVRLLPDPVLTTAAQPVGVVDAAARRLAADLLDTMPAPPACLGLAAPQIRVGLRASAVERSAGTSSPAVDRHVWAPRSAAEGRRVFVHWRRSSSSATDRQPSSRPSEAPRCFPPSSSLPLPPPGPVRHRFNRRLHR